MDEEKDNKDTPSEMDARNVGDLEKQIQIAIERFGGDLGRAATELRQKVDEQALDMDEVELAVSDVEDEALLPQDEATNEDIDGRHTYDMPHDSFTVAVEIDNNPDYIGLTASTGVIRTDGTITKTQAVVGDGYVTIGHWDSSTLTGVQGGSAPTMIETITVDGYGHVTAVTTANLNDYYYTESEVDALIDAHDTFLELHDTPATYASCALQIPRVNAAENALEFATIGTLLASGGYSNRYVTVKDALTGSEVSIYVLEWTA